MGSWIRIRIPNVDPDPEVVKLAQKSRKIKFEDQKKIK
jgi:hypothetical protein